LAEAPRRGTAGPSRERPTVDIIGGRATKRARWWTPTITSESHGSLQRAGRRRDCACFSLGDEGRERPQKKKKKTFVNGRNPRRGSVTPDRAWGEHAPPRTTGPGEKKNPLGRGFPRFRRFLRRRVAEGTHRAVRDPGGPEPGAARPHRIPNAPVRKVPQHARANKHGGVHRASRLPPRGAGGKDLPRQIPLAPGQPRPRACAGRGTPALRGAAQFYRGRGVAFGP